MSQPPAGARQLALPFTHAEHYRAQDFLAAPSNAEALRWLRHPEAWPQGRLALWGPEGCGKTHLLHAWAERQHAALLAAPRASLRPPAAPLAVDDADLWPERPLLHLLNAASEAQYPVLLAARTPPARWPVALPDLASRLRAMAAVGIGPPEDALLRALLARLLAQRQLLVPTPLQEWFLLRLPRSQGAIREAAARLDHAAMAAGGRVTRQLAQAVLAGLDQPPQAVPEQDPTPTEPGGERLL